MHKSPGVILVLIGISLLLCSCGPVKSGRATRKRFGSVVTNRIETGPTGLSSKINLQGYYVSTYRTWYDGHLLADTITTSILLYDDGTFVADFLHGQDDAEAIFHEALVTGRKSTFYVHHSWGVYSIVEDTLKVQYAWHPAKFTSAVSGERYYLLGKDSTIQLINSYVDKSPVKPTTSNETSTMWASNPPRSEMPAAPATFIPVQNVPPSLPWLKERSFFWRNESDWKLYMLKNNITKKDIL